VLYVQAAGETAWRPHSINVLEVADGAIASIVAFVGPLAPALFAGAGLPMEPFTTTLQRWEQHFTVVLWDRRDVGRTRGRLLKKLRLRSRHEQFGSVQARRHTALDRRKAHNTSPVLSEAVLARPIQWGYGYLVTQSRRATERKL